MAARLGCRSAVDDAIAPDVVRATRQAASAADSECGGEASYNVDDFLVDETHLQPDTDPGEEACAGDQEGAGGDQEGAAGDEEGAAGDEEGSGAEEEEFETDSSIEEESEVQENDSRVELGKAHMSDAVTPTPVVNTPTGGQVAERPHNKPVKYTPGTNALRRRKKIKR